jgi:hypothetical protein
MSTFSCSALSFIVNHFSNLFLVLPLSSFPRIYSCHCVFCDSALFDLNLLTLPRSLIRIRIAFNTCDREPLPRPHHDLSLRYTPSSLLGYFGYRKWSLSLNQRQLQVQLLRISEHIH